MEFSIKERSKQTFPLKHIKDVVNLFEAELTEPEEPDLVLLSIVMGSLETALTTIKDTPLKEHETDISAPTDLNNEKEEDADFPVLSLPLVENLWNQFVNQVKNINFEEENEFEDRPLIELTHSKDQEFASESQVKKIANSIWNTLSRAYYKDKPHLQTLFSYLIGKFLFIFLLRKFCFFFNLDTTPLPNPGLFAKSYCLFSFLIGVLNKFRIKNRG